jgi:hypothetical protein
MIDFYKDNLLKKIQERRHIYEVRLAAGAIEKIEDYKLVVGKVQGLDEAAVVIQNAYKELIAGSKKNEHSEKV